MLERLIEVALPLKEVSEESAREKSIRHGHISTLHVSGVHRVVRRMLGRTGWSGRAEVS